MTSTTDTEQTEKITEEALFEKLVALFEMISDIEMDIKDLMQEAKDADIEDASLVKAVAKAKAYSKVGDLEDKLKAKLEKIQELVG